MIRRAAPLRRSLQRHALVMGGERDLVMMAALIALIIGAGGQTLLCAVAGVVFWLASLFGLRRMAKADPCMSQVWRRHVRQQDFYPARSAPWGK